MALGKSITLLFPQQDERNVHTLGVNVIITDDDRPDLGEGAQEVVNENVTTTYAEGDEQDPIKDTVLTNAQKLVDRYKAERALWDDATYQQLDNYINTNLEL